jgi:hypothetical protein
MHDSKTVSDLNTYHARDDDDDDDAKTSQGSSEHGLSATNEWHKLAIEMKGTSISCYFDGTKLFEKSDPTFSGPGKIGLWTKADSYILFDDLNARGIDAGK